MLNKKIIAMVLVASTLMVGCSSKGNETDDSTATGGQATEQQQKFTGTKSTERLYDQTGKKGDVVVTSVEFKDGEPVKVSLDVRQEDGTMKKTESAAGKYVMKEGEAKRWDEQIVLLEDFLNSNGVDTTKVTLSSDAGNTDAVTGVSIKVKAYLEPIKEIIDSVKNGTELEEGFTGAKVAEVAADPTGAKKDVNIAKVVFQNGKPVNVSIDVKLEDGTMKKKLSADGGYVMKEGEAMRWDEQIAALEKFIVDNNFDLAKVTLTNDAGNTDAVTGVSIKVNGYLEAVKAALAS